MNRSIAPISSYRGFALALAAMLALMPAARAAAGTSATYTFANQSITFTHLSSSAGVTMVGVSDPGFRALLKSIGAVITWNPGERYVLITTSEPEVISFSVGDRRYDVGPVHSQARVAPYADLSGEVYLPFEETLRALYLAPKRDGGVNILQPQLASVDVRAEGSQAMVVAHAAVPLTPRVISETPQRIVYLFDGVGSTVDGFRNIGAGGIESMQIATSGSDRDPKTTMTLLLRPGAHHDPPHSSDGSDFEVAFTGSDAAPSYAQTPVAQASAPSPEPSVAGPADDTAAAVSAAPGVTAPPPAPAEVTGITEAQNADGLTFTIAIAGNASYQWHRLRAPDNRFWIDIANAQLTTVQNDQAEPDPVLSLRVRQIDSTTVRVAFSLRGQNSLAISPAANGLTIALGNQEVADAAREGSGSVGEVVSVAEVQAPITPAPLNPEFREPGSDDWKFSPRSGYVPTNPKLIVIDPGHGGSDPGSSHAGTTEASINLDTALRLQKILIARGWQVLMTRTTDVDVYAPNDSAHVELQARDDIANHAGARMYVSVHANAFINSGPRGTTTYYSKPSDLPLAQIMERSLADDGTSDDGIVKSRMYVTLHADMPAVLIETAFLSNPGDYALIMSAQWRQRVAEAIANGIDQYAQRFPVAGNGQQ